MTRPLGVALVGIGADHWSGTAHVPALAAVPGVRLVRAVTSSAESARTAQELWQVPASDALRDALDDPSVDLVAVTVRVALHFEIAAAAIKAGKHVYCEWPLGVDTGQARELADLAERHPGRLHVTGLQGRLAPEIQSLAAAVAAGRIGRPLRASVQVQVSQALEPRPAHRAHLRRRESAANVLSIQGGHVLDMLATLLGRTWSVASARVWTAVDEFTVLETGERLPRDAPDNVAAQLELGGVPVTMQLSQTATRQGSVIEVLGTEASARVVAPGQPQMTPLTATITDLGGEPQPWREAHGPADEEQTEKAPLDQAHPGYGVALAYARIARAAAAGGEGDTHGVDDGSPLATFTDAITIHEILDAIERASASA